MAEVTTVVGVPHNPFHLKQTSKPREEWTPDTARMVELGAMMADKLAAARPDVIVVVANDHYHQFFMDNMPAFLVGKMDTYDAIFHNEIREFGMTPVSIPGHAQLSGELIEGGYERGIDFAFSDAVRLDHAVVTPLLHLGLTPALDVPIVPILTNCVAPPLPPARRFLEVGRALRDTIDGLGADTRVAVVASGNVSLEVGGQRQFAPRPADEAFDDQVTEFLGTGQFERLAEFCSFERMSQAGNVTHAITNIILGAGMTDGLACTFAEAMKRPGSSQPWFAWEPKAGA